MEKQNNRVLQTEINVFIGSVLQPDKAILARTIEKKDLLSTLYDVCGGSAVLARQAIVSIKGHVIPTRNLEFIYPKEEVTITFIPAGGGGDGGKNPLQTILSLAVLVAAPYLSGVVIGSLGVAADSLSAALITGAVGATLNLIVAAIAPPSKPRLNSSSPLSSNNTDSPTFYIQGAKNEIKPFGVVPVVIGTHRFVPPQGAKPYTEAGSKTDQFVRQIFCWGYGEQLVLNELSIGDTLLTNYSDFLRDDILDGDSTAELSLFTDSVDQTDLSILIDSEDGYTVRTTGLDVDEIQVDLTFPQGLATIDNFGGTNNLILEYEFGYSLTGLDSYTSFSISAQGGTTSSIRISKRYPVTNGQYDFRIKRITPNADENDNQTFDKGYWTALRTFTYQNPVQLDGVNLTALRIKATDQLNGAIDQLNAVVSHSILDWDSDTSTWIFRETSNPASWYRYVLQGEPNAEPLLDDQIDLTSIQEWHEYCTVRGFTCNGVIDYDATVLNVLDDICSSGRAQKTIRDNNFSVIVDKVKTDIVQLVSPRNSSEYSLDIAYPALPHAFRVQFINAEKGYLQDERIVYDDGYNSSNATKFERLELSLVTTPDLAYIHAREHIATIRLRRFSHHFKMDIENLVFERGDLIRFNHDVILQGLGSGRIKSLADNGTHVTSITLDDTFVMESSVNYAIRIRHSKGSQTYHLIDTNAGEQNTVTLTVPVLIADAPLAGDLVLSGEAGTETRELIIKEIATGDDFTANITAIDYSPEIFDAATGSIPTFVSNVTLPQSFKRPVEPVLQSLQAGEEVQIINLDGSVSNRMVITLDNHNEGNIDVIVKIRKIGETVYQGAQTTERTADRVVIEGLHIGSNYDLLIYYKRVGDLVLSGTSMSTPLTLNGVSFVGASEPPGDVENFDITVRSDSVFLTWDAVTAIDLNRYEIRFNSLVTGAEWGNSLPLVTNLSKTTTSFTAFSKIGTYLIKAIDVTGTYSENPTLAVTNIGELEGLNFVKEIDESATWGGTFDATVNDAGSLKLGSTSQIDDWTLVDDVVTWDLGEGGLSNAGTYTFQNAEDLGAIYTSILSADITVSAESVLDLIDEWADINSRGDWDGTTPTQYNVVLQVRTTDDDTTASPTWSNWQPFIIGEYTARGFEFRVILTALVSDITPVVSSLQVQIDMPDRISSSDDITINATGETVTYNGGAFRTIPAIAVSADDMGTGDYYTISSKTATSFNIRFFNSGATGVQRTFSYVAKGYGKVI